MDSFSRADLVAVVGLPADTVANWLRSGYIVASGRHGRGRGQHSHFTQDDLCRAVAFARLLRLGLSRDQARDMVARIGSWEGRRYFVGELGERGEMVWTITRTPQIEDAEGIGGAALWLHLGKILAEVTAKIEAIGSKPQEPAKPKPARVRRSWGPATRRDSK